MKNSIKFVIGIVVVLGLLTAGYIFISSSSAKILSLNSPSSGGVLFQQAVVATTSTDGNSYYEERCIDVSQYYSQGYTNRSKDSHGCQIVGKDVEVGYMDLGQGTGSRPNCEYQDYYNTKTPVCPSGWSGSCRRCNWNTIYGCVECRAYATDTKGGFERVLNYCTFAQNDLLVAESFAGGQTITKMSLRYPMKSFCRAHPSIITDDITKSSTTSTNVPQDLIDGKSVSIGASQTLTVFYVIENNYNLPTICDSSKSLALDARANTTICKSTLGFTYLCSEGQFDALSGTCVVQPESKTICAVGRYDVGLGACIYNPPLQVDCGSNNCFYSVDRGVCSCYVATEFVCPSGYTLSEPDESDCADLGGNWNLCPACPIDKICSSDICKPACDRGTLCVFENPTHIICDNANATIHSDGTCTILGQTIVVCPSGQNYNEDTQNCELKPASVDVCEDGSQPKINGLTGVKECVRTPSSFLDCGVGLTYSNGTCVQSIVVYEPLTQNFTIYKEVYKGCSDDAQCGEISGNLVCNSASGFCQSPVYYQKTDYSGLLVTLIVTMIIVGVIIVLSIKKRRRK